MFVSKRILRRAGVTAALSLALAVPATGVAQATPAATATTTHAHVSNATKHHAQDVLRAAVAKAAVDYKKSIAGAQKAFRNDATVVLARGQRAAIIGGLTDPALILAANQAYAMAVTGAVETRTAAFEAARTARFAAVDAAWAAYDSVVNPARAAARNAFRAAMRTARTDLRVSTTAAHTAFRTATAAAHAQLRASVNAAVAAYQASGKTPGDLDTFKAALTTARTTYATTTAVTVAKTARHTALRAAWVTYAKAVRAARVAFHSATGHWPHAAKIVLPRI